MREKPVETRLKERLERYGFKVLKLETPGYTGTPDRLILRPIWSPGAPWVVECKRPGKHERRKQELVRDDWRARGMLVLDICDSYERVEEIVYLLNQICRKEMIDGVLSGTAREISSRPDYEYSESL